MNSSFTLWYEKANESEVMNIIGDVKGCDVIILDDMVDTAGTMVKAAKALKERGASSVRAFATHGVLSGPAIERIKDSVLEELIITDTIPFDKECKKIKVLKTGKLFAEVIRRIVYNESINKLFD